LIRRAPVDKAAIAHGPDISHSFGDLNLVRRFSDPRRTIPLNETDCSQKNW
jgi:hypothetical protein